LTLLDCFAPCPRGLEKTLADELLSLGATVDQVVTAGVAFRGDRSVAYAANLHSRIASRILLRVAQGRYRDDDDLYRLANRCEWERWFDVHRTLRIDVNAIRSPLRSLNFATLRLKDGLVDRFRTRTGVRPSIDTVTPDVRIFGFLDERGATLYLDLSGEPLFKRGWRTEREDKGEAPLKENLAAGLLALSGWTPGTPLCDPFCGSGTILIEAARIALGIAPGIGREFGFERLLDFDSGCWSRLRAEAIRHAQATGASVSSLRIAGSDIDAQAIEQVRRNAERAGVRPDALTLRCCDVRDAQAPFPEPGLVVTNPPYGERLELRGTARSAPSGPRTGRPGASFGGSRIVSPVAVDEGWRSIGRAVKEHFGGWNLWMLTSDLTLPKRLGMKERRRTPLYNGALECRLFGFEIFAGAQLSPDRGDAPQG
jgi:putative N6-adenine-specific DNA methylase